jgi:hypothetical protein
VSIDVHRRLGHDHVEAPSAKECGDHVAASFASWADSMAMTRASV